MSKLQGMDEICKYVRRSESTVLCMIRDQDFPAKKIGGGWGSDTALVDKWWLRQVSAGKEMEGGAAAA